MAIDVDKMSLDAHPPLAEEGSAQDRSPPQAAGHPLGPLVRFAQLERPVVGRLYALAFASATGALLLIALSLTPSPDGMGTHRQLWFYRYPCGFVTMTGLPCPTCGMTTAFAYAVRGRFEDAVRSQLAGFVLAAFTAVGGVTAVAAAVTGRRPAINWYRLDPTAVLWWATGLFVGAWAVKLGLGLWDGSLPAK